MSLPGALVDLATVRAVADARRRLQELENKPTEGVTLTQVEEAIREWAAKQPVVVPEKVVPVPFDAAREIAAWFADNPMPEGRGPTHSEIAAAVEQWMADHPPRDGKDGKDGVGVKSARIDESGDLWLTYTDGRKVDVGRVRGEDGKNARTIERLLVAGGGGGTTVIQPGPPSGSAEPYSAELSGYSQTILGTTHMRGVVSELVVYDEDGRSVGVAWSQNSSTYDILIESNLLLDGHTAVFGGGSTTGQPYTTTLSGYEQTILGTVHARGVVSELVVYNPAGRSVSVLWSQNDATFDVLIESNVLLDGHTAVLE